MTERGPPRDGRRLTESAYSGKRRVEDTRSSTKDTGEMPALLSTI